MWEYLTLVLTTLGILLYFLKSKIESGSGFWEKRGFPTITNTISLWQLITGQRSIMDGDNEHYKSLGERKYGGIMEFGIPLLLVKDLDLARDIFIKDFDHFFDRRDFPRTDPLFTDSLFFMEGQAWKDMRAFLSPTFTSGRIKRMFGHFSRSAQNLQKYVESHPNSEILLSEGMRKFTVDVIGAAAFGLKLDVFSDPNSIFYQMAKRQGTISLTRKIRFAFFNAFPSLTNFFKLSAIEPDVAEYFWNTLKNVLHSREANTEKGDDFLQLLVEAKKGTLKADTSSELSKEEIEAQLKPKEGGNKNNIVWSDEIAIPQAFIFLIAGFDTVANNLSVVCCMLAEHPDLQQRVYEEVIEVDGDDGDIKYEAVNSMEYLDNFLSETLRLYPAVSRLERKCMIDYPIPGCKDHVIPKGALVAFAAEAIHRDEKYWPNPNQFDPDRFTQENKANRNSYAYMPFGIGPRNCIGMRFALVETKVALAHIVRNFEISHTPESKVPGPIKEVFGYKVPPTLKLVFTPRQ